MAPRRLARVRAAAFVSILALALAGVPPASSGAPTRSPRAARPKGAPAIFPATKLRPGMRGYGLTVIEGNKIERFRVKILGVQRDALLPGVHLIISRVSGDVIRRAGGFAAGMSGSPVYIDGKLVGATAYGTAFGSFRIAGITPARPMLDILDYPNRLFPTRLPTRVPLSAELRRAVAQAGGGSVDELTSLPVPVAVSGLTGRSMRLFRRSAERAGLRLMPFSSTRAAAPGQGRARARLRPGSAYAAVLSYGDLTLAGIGTTTARAGRRSVAWGHPFLFGGSTRLGLNGARVLTVARNKLVPFKIANVGRPHGVVTQDRFAGIAGRARGAPPLTAVRSRLTNLDLAKSRRGLTQVARRLPFMPDIAFLGLLASSDRVFDRIGEGSASHAWTVRGTRAGGRRFTYRRNNAFESDFDITIESLFEVLGNVFAIQNNGFERVRITDINLTGRLTQQRRGLRIHQVAVSSTSDPEPVTDGGVFAAPGDTLTIEITLRRPMSAGSRTEIVELDVPEFAFGVMGLSIHGGTGDEFFDPFLFDDPGNGAGGGEGSLDELLDTMANAPRNNELVVELGFFGELGLDVVTGDRRAFDRVVRGQRFFDVFVDGGEPFPEEPDFLE